MKQDRIDEALACYFKREPDNAAIARVMAKLERPLPRQKHATPWLQIWPQILLDWQFAPAWPRLAALACCAALGFAVGAANLERLGGPFVSTVDNDLASVVSEPEAVTGLRP
jgi:hypothetical protein